MAAALESFLLPRIESGEVDTRRVGPVFPQDADPGWIGGRLLAAMAALFLALPVSADDRRPQEHKAERKLERKIRLTKSSTLGKNTEAAHAERRRLLIERKRAFRDGLRELLSEYERKLADQSVGQDAQRPRGDPERRSGPDFPTRAEIERLRQWIAEDSAALALAGEEYSSAVSDSPGDTVTGAGASRRFEGRGEWSLFQASRIKSFFLQRFGYPLPVSAMGQSATHDRLGLDHRAALDVALRPGSREGRALLAYLRRTGIPFIAFHGKVRGASTGAHIHIGPPSLRLVQPRPPVSALTATAMDGG